MSFLTNIQAKILSLAEAETLVQNWHTKGETIVFTNGCFDLLHYGHLTYLAQARDLGDRLVVGLNSTPSVKRLKGVHRPINDDLTRTYQLAALACVDAVVIFDDDTPYTLIEKLKPTILVKGGDYMPDTIVGADIVKAMGGQVRCLPFIAGYSTTALEQKIKTFS
jgi:D-beta-D-heptose 7-phosphate kinase/D-beta-D-heptose 1-phosphate adenosyltransferase